MREPRLKVQQSYAQSESSHCKFLYDLSSDRQENVGGARPIPRADPVEALRESSVQSEDEGRGPGQASKGVGLVADDREQGQPEGQRGEDDGGPPRQSRGLVRHLQERLHGSDWDGVEYPGMPRRGVYL